MSQRQEILTIYPAHTLLFFVGLSIAALVLRAMDKLFEAAFFGGGAVLLTVGSWHRRIVWDGETLNLPCLIRRRRVNVRSITRIMRDPSRIGRTFVSDHLFVRIGGSLAARPSVSIMVKGEETIQLSQLYYDASQLNVLIEHLFDCNNQILEGYYP